MKPVLFLTILFGIGLPASVAADELRLTAKSLFERSVTRNVRLTAAGTAIELDEGELFEDDGPAAGYSYLPNEEQLSETEWIKKELDIANPIARKATLLVCPGGDFKATINGQALDLKPSGKAGNYWQAYAVPSDILKSGRNEIILSRSGKVWIARAEDFAAGSIDRAIHPNRSAKSADAGKSWDYDRLGPTGDIDGEYYVRLFLHRFRPAGSLLLPVMDAGNLHGHGIAPPIEMPVSIRVHLNVEGGAGRLRIRSGATPDVASRADWQELESGSEFHAGGRYFQLSIKLSTADPLRSPRLLELRVETSPTETGGWFERLKVIDSDNAEIVRSAVPFAYEPFDHPRLQELRARYKLDELVKDATTELELIERLAHWSATRWDRGHLGEAYPAWDATEILKPHADGKPIGGFCQQYNLVFLQACESFGIPGRAVSIGAGEDGGKIRGGGHEVVELWSNQFRKWIYVDGNFAWYAVDAQSQTPLSLWELRSRQLRVVRGEPADRIRVVHLTGGGKRWEGLEGWPAFLELRLIPRSNFVEQMSPLPLNQGMRGWFWTGHYVWNDAEQPASLLYGNRVTNRRNWEWTLNQVRYALEAMTTPDELRIHLDTQTPGFDTYLAEIDEGGPKPISTPFIWKLRSGKNRFEVRPRNVAGRDGPTSFVVIDNP